jgi:hypothetical protein
MNRTPIILAAFLLGTVVGCGRVRTPSEQELERVWTASSSTAEERAAAVNRCFTNGTPISSVIDLLGTNYTRFTLIATYWCGEPELKKDLDLAYGLGEKSVIIRVTASEHADPLTGQFFGARYSLTTTNSHDVK